MIAVLGSSGQLGSVFSRLLDGEAQCLTRRDLDICDEESVYSWFGATRPETVINCAAYNAVDQAETDEERARSVNAIAVGRLAALCAGIGSRFVTFSTDYVFDGTKGAGYVESDPPSPLSAYGRSKLEGEDLALSNHGGSLVIRTSGLLSATHQNFVTKILDALGGGGVRVVHDQTGCPTNVEDLAPATLAALEAGATGLLHLAGSQAVSWFDLARSIAAAAGIPTDLVEPVASADFPRPAPRPRFSVLQSVRLEALGIIPLPPIGHTLDRLVADIGSSR